MELFSFLNIKRKTLIFFLCIVLAMLVLLSLRSRNSFKRGRDSVQMEKYDDAIDAFGESIRWYYPLNPWSKKSVEQLFSVAKNLEEKGDYNLASRAYLEIRHGLSSLRGFYFPMFNEAQKSSELYVDLKSRLQKNQNNPKINIETLKNEYSLRSSQKSVYMVFFVLFFLFWLSSTMKFICRGFNAEGSLNKKIIFSWLPLSLVSFGVWVWMLSFL